MSRPVFKAATWHPLGEFPTPFSDEVKEPLSAKARLGHDVKDPFCRNNKTHGQEIFVSSSVVESRGCKEVSLAFAPGEIVLTTAAGAVHRRRLQDLVGLRGSSV